MYEQLESVSPAIECRWRAVVEVAGTYPDPASEHWDLAFTRRTNGSLAAELAGPTLTSRVLDGHVGECYWGVQLSAHVVLPGVDKAAVLGAVVQLPVEGDEVAIAGVWQRIPCWSQLEDFVDLLLRSGVLVSDEHVRRALSGDDSGFSPRSWQRRFRRVTGLSRKQIEQLDRAQRAYYHLQCGLPPAEVAAMAGYADQAHLTRSLRRVRGETPARILAAAAAAS